MSREIQEQSHGIDEDCRQPKYKMPQTLKKLERRLEEMLGRESFNYSQQMQKVPPVLRLENGSDDYDPMVVALGPYHHGKPKLKTAETFKSKALEHIITDTGKSVRFFFNKVFEQVGNVRKLYTEDSTKKFTDSTFAQMMLLDACFIISYILAPRNPRFASTILSDLGHLDFSIIYRDLFLLENQIPLWFLKDVICLGYQDSNADDLVDEFIYKFSNVSRRQRKEKTSDELPIHFLDAVRRVLLSKCCEVPRTYVSPITCWIKNRYDDICSWKPKKYIDVPTGEQEEQEKRDEDTTAEQQEQEQCDDDSTAEQEKQVNCNDEQVRSDDDSIAEQEEQLRPNDASPGEPVEQENCDNCIVEQDKQEKQEECDDDSTQEQNIPCFHSASDLKAKGIHFRPSRDYSLTGLSFKSGYCYAQLQLPILHVSTHTKVFFSNLIAYESCLKSPERKVTAYTKFMKSLIVHADDVKELRENGIWFTSLGSDEEVVKMFKELSTSTLSTEKVFEDVRGEIQEHFRSKFKPRLGEFLYTYFRSPWTAIGTFAAIALLVLTLLQTVFTIKRP